MKKFIFTILFLLIAIQARADDLGCFQNANTVQLFPNFILAGASTAATSKSAFVYNPAGTLDTTIADGSFTQIDATNMPGKYRATTTAGSTEGIWTVSYKGTMSGTVYSGGDDVFTVKTSCDIVIASGTINSASTTSTLIYTALADSTRKYINMCLWSTTTGERSKILSTGATTWTVRGFSSAPTNSSAIKVYTGGCQ